MNASDDNKFGIGIRPSKLSTAISDSKQNEIGREIWNLGQFSAPKDCNFPGAGGRQYSGLS